MTLLQDTFKCWTAEESDLVFFTNDGSKLFTSKKVICAFSAMIRDIVKDVHTEVIAVIVPISFSCLDALISLLVRGVSESVDKKEISAAASILDITIGNIVEGNVESNLNDISAAPNKVHNHSNLKIEIKLEADNFEFRELENTEWFKFRCKESPKQYTHQDSLKRQRKTHTLTDDFDKSGGNDYNEEIINYKKSVFLCEQCNKEYSSSDGLKRHKLIHSSADGKPFSCGVCDNRFSRNDTLGLHIKKAHADPNTPTEEKERYPCIQCDKTFSRKDVLIKHVKNMHAKQLGHIPLSDLVEYSHEEEF